MSADSKPSDPPPVKEKLSQDYGPDADPNFEPYIVDPYNPDRRKRPEPVWKIGDKKVNKEL